MDKIYPFVKELLIEKYILGKKFIAFLYSFNLYQSSLIFNITRLIKLTNIYVNFKIGGIILKRGTFQLMKSVNKSIVLNKIRESAPISRAQIAKETSLTPPTVSSIVKELIEENIIIERKSEESVSGRRPIMLHINEDAFLIIGIDAGPEQVIGIISNLAGDIKHRHFVSYEKPLDKERFLDVLKTCIRDLKKKIEIDLDRLLGVGIAMHGVVNVEEGISLVTPNLGLKDIPIKETLENEFDIEVKVENDVRLMALGETWFGGHGSVESMVVINLGRGVGGGIVLNGDLYHGWTDLAGEIGHMTIDMNGPVCECGNRGCFQTFATGHAIAKRAREKMNISSDESLKLTGRSVYELAKAGNELHQNVLKETGKYIGVALSNIIHVLNPKRIVLGGGVMNSEHYLMPEIVQTIENRALIKHAKETEIMMTNLGKDATVLGAVAQFLVEVYE